MPFVGWVFVERLPVKGPVSRKATRARAVAAVAGAAGVTDRDAVGARRATGQPADAGADGAAPGVAARAAGARGTPAGGRGRLGGGPARRSR